MTPERSSQQSPDAIVITGVGLTTPVGHDSVSAAAAMRAGIARFRKVPHFMTATGVGAAGALAYGLTDDRSGSDRLLAMAIPALQEALFGAENSSDDLDLARCRLLLSLGPESRPSYENFGPDDLQALLEDADALRLNGSTEIIRDGHAGGALAIQEAMKLLREGSADCCIVGGADSLVEFPVLSWLNEAGRLKTDDQPDGFIPGEAAAFLVLETATRAKQRGAVPVAEISHVAIAREEAHLRSGEPLQGVGLTLVLRETLSKSDIPIGGMLCDGNGEYWRAKEWSLAMTRVFAKAPAVPPLWLPAQSIGDVGAASIPVLAAIAVASLRHGYLPGSSVLLWASSDGGGRGALALRAHPAAGASS